MAGNAAPDRVSLFKAGFGCRCPRCGKGKLYAGFLTIAERCSVCGLDLKARDTGDGPAVFIILILGFVVVALAFVVELFWGPPMWVHLLLWIPFIIAGSALMLHPAKAIFIAQHYRHRSGEDGGMD
jgi:uncharacterized protein (DUF983 family)